MAETWGDTAQLRAAAESLNDAVAMRIATENRVKRGGTVDAFDAEVGAGAMMIRFANDHEDRCRDLLRSVYEVTVPDGVREWARGVPGMASGEVFPKLMGLIGNPRVAVPYRWDTSGDKRVLVPDGEPYERTLRQFWAYCGCGDPERKVRAGMSQAEMLAVGKRSSVRPVLYAFTSYLARQGTPVTKEGSRKLGQPMSQVVADSDYFRVFSEAKAAGAGKVHAGICRNRARPPAKPNGCATTAHPEWGEPGSPWRPGHQVAHAHRVAAKAFLADLFRVCGEVPGGGMLGEALRQARAGELGEEYAPSEGDLRRARALLAEEGRGGV